MTVLIAKGIMPKCFVREVKQDEGGSDMTLDDIRFIWENTDPLTILIVCSFFWLHIKGLKADIRTVRSDIQDIDRRLCRLEGALMSKECCVLKDDSQLRKVE